MKAPPAPPVVVDLAIWKLGAAGLTTIFLPFGDAGTQSVLGSVQPSPSAGTSNH